MSKYPWYHGYVVASLRRIWRWSPERKAVKNASPACRLCKKKFTPKDKPLIDHKDPVVSVKDGFQTWDIYIERLFCPESNLQALCKMCHDAKSKEEKKLRKKAA